MKTILILSLLTIIGETVNLYSTRKNPAALLLIEVRFHLFWLLYFFASLELRANYITGQKRGYHIINANEQPSWFSGDYYFTYDKTKYPEREYATYKDLRSAWRKGGRL